MRALLAISTILFLSSLVIEESRADEGFPYHAIVIEDTEIRSGPAKVHYATEQVKIGTPVIVFRHDPGDWCAIQPITSAFSMIPVSDLTISKSGRWGKAKSDDVKVWVGTSVEEVKEPLCQVQIAKGEIVEIREAIKIVNGNHSELWCRVSPPPGEFRWIKKSSLRRKDEEPKAVTFLKKTLLNQQLAKTNAKSATKPESSAIANSKNLTETESNQPKPFTPSPIPKKLNIGKSSSHAAFENSSTTKQKTSGGWIAKNGPKAGMIFPEDVDSSRTKQANAETAIADPQNLNSARVQNGAPLAFGDQLRQLELDLTLEILKQKRMRDFAPFSSRANDLLKLANNQTEKNLAQNFQNKVSNFAKLQKRRFDTTPPSTRRVGFDQEIDDKSVFEKADRGTASISKLQKSSEESPFDASGFLNQLYSNDGKRSDGFVLLDENEKITHIVSPSAGFNLDRYSKKKVGLIGRLGYHAKYKLPHIRVDRAVLIKEIDP